jgi:hypothetical protein
MLPSFQKKYTWLNKLAPSTELKWNLIWLLILDEHMLVLIDMQKYVFMTKKKEKPQRTSHSLHLQTTVWQLAVRSSHGDHNSARPALIASRNNQLSTTADRIIACQHDDRDETRNLSTCFAWDNFN